MERLAILLSDPVFPVALAGMTLLLLGAWQFIDDARRQRPPG